MVERVSVKFCRSVCLLALALLSCAWAAASELQIVRIPGPAPSGDDPRLLRQIANYAGRPLVINFWASWCEPCRDEMPALARLGERLSARGAVVLTVAVADREADVVRFMQETRLSLPVLHDREQMLSRAWGARMLPYTVVLDRRHRVVAQAQGVVDWEDDAVVERLRRLFE